jgi:hypothetical protein
MIPATRKKMIISLIFLILILALFLYPLSTLLEDYTSAPPLIGEGAELSLSEPAIMFLFGSGLIGVAVFAKKTLRKKIKDLGSSSS